MPSLPTDRSPADAADTPTEHANDHNSVHTLYNAITAVWATWSPTLTNLTLGNGTVVAKWLQSGKTVYYRFKFTLGSTSAVGTSPRFTLPAAPHADYAVDRDLLGSGAGTDASAGSVFPTSAWWVSGSTVVLYVDAGAATGLDLINATFPFTWTTSDSISVTGVYEVA